MQQLKYTVFSTVSKLALSNTLCLFPLASL